MVLPLMVSFLQRGPGNRDGDILYRDLFSSLQHLGLWPGLGLGFVYNSLLDAYQILNKKIE